MKVHRGLIKKIFLVFMVYALLCSFPPFVRASGIADGVKKTIDAVIEVVTDEELKKNAKKAERRVLLREIISKKFNYFEMSRRSLSKYWEERTPEEKKEFIDLFGKLLENSYSSKIESYTDEKIIYKEEKVKGNKALVKTIVFQGDDQIPVNYKLIKSANDWMVYDFTIEGVSMIKNYRAQFKRIIRKSSYQELVKKLKKKVESFSDGSDLKSDAVS